MHGGTVYPMRTVREICDGVHERGLKVHMDGARIFNAAAALGIPVREIAAPADTVMFCLSKALGAPAGSILAGPARRSSPKAGSIASGSAAACGRSACSPPPAWSRWRRRPSASSTTTATRSFSPKDSSRIPGIQIDPARVQTNIAVFDVSGTGSAPAELSAAPRERGVLMNAINERQMRAVTHYDVDRAAVRPGAGGRRRTLVAS